VHPAHLLEALPLRSEVVAVLAGDPAVVTDRGRQRVDAIEAVEPTSKPVGDGIAQEHERPVGVRERTEADGQDVVHVDVRFVVPSPVEVDRMGSAVGPRLRRHGTGDAHDGQREDPDESTTHQAENIEEGWAADKRRRPTSRRPPSR
jgi:hypothetical protein